MLQPVLFLIGLSMATLMVGIIFRYLESSFYGISMNWIAILLVAIGGVFGVAS